MKHKQKLSTVEQIVDANIVYYVRLEGNFTLEQLRSALSRVQRKHPVLRALLRKEQDRLYYEADSAPEISLRVIRRRSEDDYRRERHIELTTEFSYHQPQLRAVWLQSEWNNEFLFTAPHRICDAMSMFTIVKELLRALYSDEELIPYEAVTTEDIIGGYQPPQPLKRTLAVHLVNGLLHLIPGLRRVPVNNEHYLEWKADRPLSDALKQRCKLEGVSMHAVLVVLLERALFAMFGKKLPKGIINPIDLRRGRFSALKSDMVFYGGGNFKLNTSQTQNADFWTRARAVNEEIRREVEKEIHAIPGRFHFVERIRPLSSRQMQSIVWLGDVLKFKYNGSWNRFGLSNLGNVVIDDSDAPFRLKDLRIYMHSFNFRTLGLVPYTLNGEMRFCCMSDEKCMTPSQLDTLKREFMAVLQHQALRVDRKNISEFPQPSDKTA